MFRTPLSRIIKSAHYLLIAAVISTGYAGSNSEHQFIYKRIYRGFTESAEILQIPKTAVDLINKNKFLCKEQTKRLVHCVMILLHTWNDNTGLQRSALTQFFEPTAYEGLYRIRTSICLAKDLPFVDKGDFNTRAYVTFNCFYREYGYLARSPHFVIFKQPLLISVMSASIAIANVPQSTLKRSTVVNVCIIPKTYCLLYIFSLRAGFYNGVGCILLCSLYSQFGNSYSV